MRRRDEILAAAAGLFASDGYTNTSMREVAAASGILAGSLYHHFESKEAIAVELVEAYHADLVRVVREFGSVPVDPLPALRAYAQAIAAVSFRHPAALQISLFDAPTTASSSLKTVVHAEPASVNRLWRSLISAAAKAGAMKDGVNLRILRYVLHRTTLNAGLLWGWRDHPGRGRPRSASPRSSSTAWPRRRPLGDDSSKAIRVVERRPGPVDDDATSARARAAQVLAAARDQFALRGFSDRRARRRGRGGPHREQPLPLLRSKDSMIDEILGDFSDRLTEAYRDVIEAGSSVVEILDAILWLLDQAGRFFSREIEILQGFKRLLDIGVADRYQEGAELRFGLLVGVVDSGVTAGELSQVATSDLVATCLREIMWSPMRNLAPISALRVRDFYRHSVLSGAAAHG